MIERITHVMIDSGSAWVLWTLFALSFLCVVVALERTMNFQRTRADLVSMVPELRRALRASDYARAAALLEKKPSVPGRVVAAGLVEAAGGPSAASEAMAAAMGLERKRLEQRLVFLGTVGNNAPFIGLLGTVIGVVGAFDALGKPQSANAAITAAMSAVAPERVMSTIAEALVATAVGLVVAIPAVAVFNYFQARVAQLVADAETLGHVLLSHLQSRASHANEALSRRVVSLSDRPDMAAE
ncbi:MAG TPA: MotA/TolQ/ExbB proton channel family protein [Polyangiales bacterium]|jgi:biopolymer transport protein ExbB|nr:MotA/TolQ/ExbB proton channel family protein [Polyangiales bacterium]